MEWNVTCYKEILGGEGHEGICSHTRCRNLQHSVDSDVEAPGVLETPMDVASAGSEAIDL